MCWSPGWASDLESGTLTFLLKPLPDLVQPDSYGALTASLILLFFSWKHTPNFKKTWGNTTAVLDLNSGGPDGIRCIIVAGFGLKIHAGSYLGGFERAWKRARPPALDRQSLTVHSGRFGLLFSGSSRDTPSDVQGTCIPRLHIFQC